MKIMNTFAFLITIRLTLLVRVAEKSLYLHILRNQT